MWIQGFEFERFKDKFHNINLLNRNLSTIWYVIMLILTSLNVILLFLPNTLVSAKQESVKVKTFSLLLLLLVWVTGIACDITFSRYKKKYNINTDDWNSSNRWMSSVYIEKLPRGRFVSFILVSIWCAFLIIAIFKFKDNNWSIGDVIMYMTIFMFIPTTPLLFTIGIDSSIGDKIEIFRNFILFYADDIDFKDSYDYFEVPTFVSTEFVRLKKVDKDTYILKIMPDKPCYMIFDRDFVNYNQLSTEYIQNFNEGSVFNLDSIYVENIDTNFIYKETTFNGYEIILKRKYFTNFSYLIEDLKFVIENK